MKARLFGFFVLGAAACASASVGDIILSSKPNLLVEANPLQHISEQLRADHIRACDAPTTEIGQSSNIPISEIEYPSYNQEGRPAHVINLPYSFGISITAGQYKGKYLRVTVPPGFVSDFHSVPLSITSQASPLRKAIAAAVVHDWMFAVGNKTWQRDLANQAFDDIAKYYQVDSFTREMAQNGFNAFGNANFGKPDELRFYNKCFYRGLCPADVLAANPSLRKGPVMSMPHTGTYAPLRAALWDLTVCIRELAPGDGPAAPVAR
jgi:hypothetical protein